MKPAFFSLGLGLGRIIGFCRVLAGLPVFGFLVGPRRRFSRKGVALGFLVPGLDF